MYEPNLSPGLGFVREGRNGGRYLELMHSPQRGACQVVAAVLQNSGCVLRFPSPALVPHLEGLERAGPKGVVLRYKVKMIERGNIHLHGTNFGKELRESRGSSN